MTTQQDQGQRGDRMWLVAAAASLWGTSAVMRGSLLEMGLGASMIVLVEHGILVLCLAPWLGAAVRGLRRASRRTQASVLVIGVGSSALATTMFTAAFGYGDPITPQVLQKLQPVFALVLAAVLLGERVRRRFWLFAVPAFGGAWLLAFREPLDVDIASAQAAALALGAAALWGAGTVLGRQVGAELSATDVTVLRFAGGLVTMVVVVSAQGAWTVVPWPAVPVIAVQALIPGLLALTLYYRGLRRTPASRATIAELAFPVTAAAVGVLVLDGELVASQWVGFVVVLLAVTAMVLHESASRRPAVAVPDPVEDAVPVR